MKPKDDLATRLQEVASTLAASVHRQTEGNPLFVQEIVRYLAEEGFMIREGARGHPNRTMGPDPADPGEGFCVMSLANACRGFLRTATVCYRLRRRSLGGTSRWRLCGCCIPYPLEESLLSALEEGVGSRVLQNNRRWAASAPVHPRPFSDRRCTRESLRRADCSYTGRWPVRSSSNMQAASNSMPRNWPSTSYIPPSQSI